MSAPGVARVVIEVGGSEIATAVGDKLVDLVTDGQLRVPDRLTACFRDFDLDVVDNGPFTIGAAITATLGSAETAGSTKVFDGQITALEPEFSEQGAQMVVSALDRGHLLQREARTASYQQMSYGEIAQSLVAGAGLVPGSISAGLRLPFVQQSNETDWDFLWRLALEVDYVVKVVGRSLDFRPAGQASGAPVELAWGKTLRAFRPRVSGVQQVEEVTVRGWDPSTATAIEATAQAPAAESQMGIARDGVVSALGSGGASVVDYPVIDQDHAKTIATSRAAQLASVFVEGEGTAQGTPALAAGGQVRISGAGQKFSGTYAVTGVRHVFRGKSGFRTQFTISGRAHRTVLGLSRPPEAEGWQHRIVVGVVTNTSDPDKLGRVRVKYPALDDQHEGWWARVLAPGSGAARGLFSLPQMGDEVLIVFEHGNPQHPYLLGSVFNGQSLPDTVAQPDGSFTLATPHQVTITATEKAAITTKDTLTLTAVGATTITTKPGDDEKAAGPISVSAKGALSLASDAAATVGAATTGAFTAKQGLTLSGGTEVTVSADGSVTISGGSLTLKGTQSVTVSAPMIMLG